MIINPHNVFKERFLKETSEPDEDTWFLDIADNEYGRKRNKLALSLADKVAVFLNEKLEKEDIEMKKRMMNKNNLFVYSDILNGYILDINPDIDLNNKYF
jgi:hypothetical protein